MGNPHVVVERRAGYLRVLLSRPERRNALDPGMVAALSAVMRDASDEVVVLGSADPRAFCAGADLKIPVAERAMVSDLLYECYEHIVTRPGPVIAVLRGPAVGGGAQLAAAADLRLAGPAARLRWAGPPGAGQAVGAWILPDLVGRGVALELTMTGRWIGAAEALALGLVHRLDDDPDRAVADLAETAGTLGRRATGQIKTIASADGLVDRLQAERRANRAAWEQLIRREGG